MSELSLTELGNKKSWRHQILYVPLSSKEHDYFFSQQHRFILTILNSSINHKVENKFIRILFLRIHYIFKHYFISSASGTARDIILF